MTPILKNLEFKPSAHVPTMGVAANGWGVYNEDFVNQLSDSELKFVLLHEASHILLKHPQRSAKYSGIDPKDLGKTKDISDIDPEAMRKFEFMNIAEDAIINDNLTHTTPFTMVEGGVTMSKVSTMCRNKKIEELRKLSAEEICDLLLANPENQKQGNGGNSNNNSSNSNGNSSNSQNNSQSGQNSQQQQDSSGSGDNQDNNENNGNSNSDNSQGQGEQQQQQQGSGSGSNGSQEQSDSDSNEQNSNGSSGNNNDSYAAKEQKLQQAIKKAYKHRNPNTNMPNAVEEAIARATNDSGSRADFELPSPPGTGHSNEHRVLEDAYKRNNINWKKVLYALTQKMSGKNERSRSWRRPSRKYRDIYPISQGQARNKKKSLVFSIDISGSMDAEKTSRAMDTVESYAKHNDLNFKYYFFDTRYSAIYTFKNIEDFKYNLANAGSGGTDYNAALRIGDPSFHPDGLVVISDMEFGDIDTKLIEKLVNKNFVFLDVGGSYSYG